MADARVLSRYGWQPSIVDFVEGWGRERPLARAIADDTEAVSYQELNQRADCLGAALMDLGIAAPAIVGVCVESSVDFVVAILAVLKAGLTYTPLDPGYPDERLAFVLGDSGASVVVSDVANWSRFADFGGTVLRVGATERYSAPSAGPIPANRVNTIPVCLLYTSGSTGLPKGVLLGSGGFVNAGAWQRSHYGVDTSARCSQYASVSFDAASWEIWTTLMSGAELVIPSRLNRVSVSSLIQWLADSAITHCFLPTIMGERLLEDRRALGLPLKYLFVAGDRLRRYPPPGLPFEVHNLYGPTECTVLATSAHIEPAAKQSEALPPIGRPIDGVAVTIRDTRGRVVPVGRRGEIWISGAGLGLGYWRRPELTAERFRRPRSGLQRAFRTGDLGRYDSQGVIHFLGRSDRQVKVRGVRIEPAEVELALRNHVAVGDCVVRLWTCQNGEDVLVAYYTTTDGRDVRDGELWDLARMKLPPQCVPSAYVHVSKIPVTHNGKVDVAALPAPPSPF